MTADLLTKWLTHYDPVHRGWTPAGIASGVCASNGFFFPRIRGGYNLRREIGSVPQAGSRIVGAAGFDAAQIRTFPWVSHAANATYTYRVTVINGGGVEEWAEETVSITGFDASGNWVGARPNPPGDLRVIPLAGGKFLLQWTYTREGEQAEPAAFRVYHDGGSGSVDYNTIIASVAYRRGRFHYMYTSIAFTHGTRVRWAVRAASAAGAEEKNTQVAFGWADAAAPPVNPTVIVS